MVVTTDGSISEIPREEYEEAEERVITELKSINKPFVILLNSVNPHSESTKALAQSLKEKYGIPVLPVSCVDINLEEIKNIISNILFEFPIKEISVNIPSWLNALSASHWLKNDISLGLLNSFSNIKRISEIGDATKALSECKHITNANVNNIFLGNGNAEIDVILENDLFYKIITETSGLEINSDQELMSCISGLAEIKRKFEKFQHAIDEVEATGYGIVLPTLEELSLEEPEIMRQGGRYGVRLKASAPSIHMMKANITTEVNPIVGSEKQSEDLVMYMLKEFEEDPIKIWGSNIFGKSLNELVNEGLHTKLARMPDDARMKLQETLERLINEGCSGLICIIL